ncbi:MAG: hypothetical protein PF961_05635, partial [Planctomycetota bacterium]|nr:hypothetical protein [Planctomycetota bacterium]
MDLLIEDPYHMEITSPISGTDQDPNGFQIEYQLDHLLPEATGVAEAAVFAKIGDADWLLLKADANGVINLPNDYNCTIHGQPVVLYPVPIYQGVYLSPGAPVTVQFRDELAEVGVQVPDSALPGAMLVGKPVTIAGSIELARNSRGFVCPHGPIEFLTFTIQSGQDTITLIDDEAPYEVEFTPTPEQIGKLQIEASLELDGKTYVSETRVMRVGTPRTLLGPEYAAATSKEGATDPLCIKGATSADLSHIDNTQLSHHHFAADYAAGAPVGCLPCGGGNTPANARPEVSLQRIHRYRDIDHQGSFGPGVFHQYDQRLHLMAADEGPAVAEYWNPLLPYPLYLDDDGQNAGHYTHAERNMLADIQLYEDAGLLISAASPATANYAVLRSHDGALRIFEIFDLGADIDPGYRAGRLIREEDPDGNAIVVTYHSAVGSIADNIYAKLWRIATITDPAGRVLSFSSYQSEAGGYVVSEAQLPTGGDIAYHYDRSEMLGVTAIDFPDNTTATFTADLDAENGAFIVAFDDPGAAGTHRRKQVHLSQSNWEGIDQPANRVRRVYAGDGELTYANWIEADPNDSERFFTYVMRGAGSLMRFTAKAGVPEKTERAVSWDPNEFDTTTYTWETVASFTANGNKRIATESTPVGVVVDNTYDPVTGARIGAEFKDGATVLGREIRLHNSAKRPSLEVDRYGRAVKHVYDQAKAWRRLSTTRGLSYNREDSDTELTVDTATWHWTYTAGGQVETETDANGNTAVYDYYANGLLHTVTQPADVLNGPEAVTTYTYYAGSGLVHTVSDPLGRTVTYGYDARARQTSASYDDGSVETIEYGTGVDANLVVATVDRNGTRTEYGYDSFGRKVLQQITADKDGAFASPDGIQTWAYIPGTELVDVHVAEGVVIDFDYDARQRVVAITTYPQGDPTAGRTTSTTYDAFDRVAYTTGPDGHRSFLVYDLENRVVRTVREALSGAIIDTDPTALANLVRDDGDNSDYVITDTSYLTVPLTAGETSNEVYRHFDPRGVAAQTSYDWQGRVVAQIAAAAQLPTASNDLTAATAITDPKLQGRTEYSYDDQGNRTAVREPRYRDPTDPTGYLQAETTMTYTGRNLLATRTRAAIAGEPAAVESWTYHLDGKLASHTDARGSLIEQIYQSCCGRLAGVLGAWLDDPADPEQQYRPLQLSNVDHLGNRTHSAVVAWRGAQPPAGAISDPVDADTLSEVTTRYDHRSRPIARTTWLVPRGVVDSQDPPIAGEDGVPAADGLTTRFEYDDSLATIDLTLPSYMVDLSDVAAVDAAAYSAVAQQGPSGAVRVTISDALGRTVKRYNAAGHASIVTYDQLSTGGEVDSEGAAIPAGLIQIRTSDAVGSERVSYTDGLGRRRYTRDATDAFTTALFDPAGNLVTSYDANGVGQSSVYDVLGRRISRTDTEGDSTATSYNANGQPLRTTDGRNVDTLYAYDARGRRVSTTDRLLGLTTFSYDAGDLVLSITDADANAAANDERTVYSYDARGKLLAEHFPGHQAGSVPGDAGYDGRRYRYNAAGRMVWREDQAGLHAAYLYDLAGRLTTRSYDDALNDLFEHDASGRIARAESQRYGTVVERSYHMRGTLDEERLAYAGTLYTVDHAYDNAGRLTGITYPNGVDELTVGYTERHQLDTLVWNGAATPLADWSYDTGGREQTRTFANAVATMRTYRDDNLVNTIVATGPSGAVLDYLYDYDANKRKTSETDQVRADLSQAFGYDDADRLTSWTRTGPGQPPSLTQSWDLSLVGDWQQTVVDGVAEGRDHNGVHELTDVGGVALSYEARGNLILDQQGQGLDWDVE